MVYAAYFRNLLKLGLGLGLSCSLIAISAASSDCEADRVKLQVLGSGGPEIGDQRASTSYLIWLDDKAAGLVDIGSGSLVNLEQTPANINDITAVLLSHLHTDHSADIVGLIKASYFSNRKQTLSVYGPDGNRAMPSTSQFIERLFGIQGAYPYLADYLPKPAGTGAESFQLAAVNVSKSSVFVLADALTAQAVPVRHGPIPALAWAVTAAGCKIAFTGDLNSYPPELIPAFNRADLLVAHLAIGQSAGSVAKSLHLTPAQIGKLAQETGAQRLVLSHRMRRTLGDEAGALAQIERYFQGVVVLAQDRQTIQWSEITSP